MHNNRVQIVAIWIFGYLCTNDDMEIWIFGYLCTNDDMESKVCEFFMQKLW